VDTLQAIANRHGVMKYRPAPVESDKIDKVLLAAIAAPSTANTQPWEFIVVTEPSLAVQVAKYLLRTQEEYVLRRLLQAPEDFIQRLMRLYEGFGGAPCFIVLCRSQRADIAPAEYARVVRDWDLCSIGAAMANLMAAATDLGLGTRWFGNPMIAEGGAALKEMLGIPESVEVVAVTPLGYHDEPPKERPIQSRDALAGFRRGDSRKLAALLRGRLPLKEVVHHNGYGSR